MGFLLSPCLGVDVSRCAYILQLHATSSQYVTSSCVGRLFATAASVCSALLGSRQAGGRARTRAGGREERAQAELAAHNQLVTQLTLLHHQVRSQNIVQPGYFVPRNVLADAYYTPVRCDPVPSGLALLQSRQASV